MKTETSLSLKDPASGIEKVLVDTMSALIEVYSRKPLAEVRRIQDEAKARSAQETCFVKKFCCDTAVATCEMAIKIRSGGQQTQQE